MANDFSVQSVEIVSNLYWGPGEPNFVGLDDGQYSTVVKRNLYQCATYLLDTLLKGLNSCFKLKSFFKSPTGCGGQ